MNKISVAMVCTMSLMLPHLAQSEDGSSSSERKKVSPVFNIKQPESRHRATRTTSSALSREFRTIDGSDNNEQNPSMGAALTQLQRLFSPAYSDGISTLAGANRPSARAISNAVASQTTLLPNTLGASDFLWQWGQFLDHDIDLTDGSDPAEHVNIVITQDDDYFIAGPTMVFNRSLYDAATGSSTPRQQLNEITAWIDASNVYGSEEERAHGLRTFDGTGRLKTSTGDLLPFNDDGFANAGGDGNHLFLAGDVRANEQIGLAVMHTLFVREHNRLVTKLVQRHPGWSGDQLYEKARQIVGAQMQVITYREFLPALLGPNALKPYQGYQPDVNAGIANAFSTAAYRFGHSALSPTLLRLQADGTESEFGHLALKDAFFAPSRLVNEGGIEPILRGLAAQACQTIDSYVVDDVRNFLFGEPPSSGFDLVSLNIQRGRDHGLPSYNQARVALGLTAANNVSDISSDSEIQDRLAQVYESVDDIDLWVGGLAEDALPGGHLGSLFTTIIAQQFEALRDGDRFWYARVLNEKERLQVESTSLADIIRRNTTIGDEIQSNVFYVDKQNRQRKEGGDKPKRHRF